jgi:hypothetical protein
LSPVTHLLIGWSVANAAPIGRRERALVALAGIAPDLDGLGILADLATRSSASPTAWWGSYHHLLGHNLGFALLLTGVALAASRRRWLAASLVWLSIHLHFLGDIVGARGPDGYQWPIPYLLPFSDAWQLTWEGQWALNAWPNFLVTGVALGLTLYFAWRRGVSPLEVVSRRADAVFVFALRKRFGYPASAPSDR